MSFPPGPGARMHLLGIAGTAMASLAGLLKALGYRVSGSDERAYPPMSTRLEREGIRVLTPFRAENLPVHCDAVVVGNAVSRGNPELEAALDRRERLVSFPETLRETVLRARRPVVVAGTHGKTTTTSLLAFMLRTAGRDAGYLVGGVAPDLGGSARLGAPGEAFVVEGDEYDTAFWDKGPKFLHYLAETAIVGNVEFDHADIYPDRAAVERVFSFLARLPPRPGLLLLGADSPAAAALAGAAHCRVETFGLSAAGPSAGGRPEPVDWAGTVEESGPRGTRLGVVFRREPRPPLRGRFWGAAQCRNLLAAAAAADRLGVPWEAVRRAAAAFSGVVSRMEVLHEGPAGPSAGGSGAVSDGAQPSVVARDFAHHPTAVAAILEAACCRWPGHRLVAVFEPRSYTARSAVFQAEFAAAFDRAATVLISAAPEARGRAPGEGARLDTGRLARDLGAWGRTAAVVPDLDELAERALEAAVGPGPAVLLFLSNGHFGGLPERVAARVAGRVVEWEGASPGAVTDDRQRAPRRFDENPSEEPPAPDSRTDRSTGPDGLGGLPGDPGETGRSAADDRRKRRRERRAARREALRPRRFGGQTGNGRLEDLGRFYRILDSLEQALGGARRLSDCSGYLAWPERGVYFFREDGEIRAGSGCGPRIVRVGTHALKRGSRTRLWTRLRSHKGRDRSGSGNHRVSIFRGHVGNALRNRDGFDCPDWDRRNRPPGTITREIRERERPLEEAVSRTIGAMPFLWLAVEDEPGPDSLRGFLERNAISLLSGYGRLAPDPPSESWLGLHCARGKVRPSGLWNTNHVEDDYDPAFLDELARFVERMKPPA